MNFHLLKILVLNEMRLRTRRLSSIVALLAVSFLSWNMIADPLSGYTMMAINDARILYNSAALALGSASMGSPLFCLIGFYLVRGRIGEDLRSGIGGVIGASPIGNLQFLFARWLGGVAYLLALSLAYLATVLVCHLLRGEGPLELAVYLTTYALLFLPMVLFSVSCAIMFDSFALLMGKFGDVLYFLLWIAQSALIATFANDAKVQISPLMVLDFSGLATTVMIFKEQMHSNQISIGGALFDPKLPALTMPDVQWHTQLLLLRANTFLLSLLPLIPAALFFHRYSPDRVKASSAKQRRTPLALLNQYLRPLARLSNPLFRLAANMPGIAGQVMADIALIFATAPSAILLLLVCNVMGLLEPFARGSGSLIFATTCWGILASDISSRDFAADCERLTGIAPGGIARRYLRQVLAAATLGLLFSASVLLRWIVLAPQNAAILLVGIFSLAALATLLGRTSRTPRTFMALFMFWLFVATQAVKFPLMDVVGFNGFGNLASMGVHGLIGVIALVAGMAYNRWRSEVA